ncbi:MAG: PorP/SprF family type IX secretion system membrane protein [Chitinophagales bacterium]|nr:PorP/SprF family type IX secretion system membrane protein [Chitinophagales bacterium]MDW8418307.1 PorP/SprF family type IX secretion system membrane protein [Chitinophagales bacterium]
MYCTKYIYKIKKCVGAAALYCCASLATGQDIHFTQFFSHPLSVNPAQTGLFEGNYRLGLNAKMQWAWALQPGAFNYHTETPYADFSFGERKIKVGWFGAGFHFVNDDAGDGRLRYRRWGMGIAYHQAFDKHHRYILSAGVSYQYIIRSVDFSKFYFNNQWVDDEGFNLTINSQEPLKTENFSMGDLQAGLHLSAHILNLVRLDAGFAMLHINRPRHTFLGTDERLGYRYQVKGGVSYFINERMSITADAYYTTQKRAREITFGMMYSYGFFDGREIKHRIHTGFYHRFKDMVAPVIGYSFLNTRLLLNYDINISQLLPASRADGGLEISFVHTGAWGKDRYRGKKMYCPSFKR